MRQKMMSIESSLFVCTSKVLLKENTNHPILLVSFILRVNRVRVLMLLDSERKNQSVETNKTIDLDAVIWHIDFFLRKYHRFFFLPRNLLSFFNLWGSPTEPLISTPPTPTTPSTWVLTDWVKKRKENKERSVDIQSKDLSGWPPQATWSKHEKSRGDAKWQSLPCTSCNFFVWPQKDRLSH